MRKKRNKTAMRLLTRMMAMLLCFGQMAAPIVSAVPVCAQEAVDTSDVSAVPAEKDDLVPATEEQESAGEADEKPDLYIQNYDTIQSTAALSASKKIIGIIFGVLQYVGAGLMIWGFVMFALAIKDEQANSKSVATMLIITGAMLMTFRALLQAASIVS